MYDRFPTAEQIRQRLYQGCSYEEAIEGERSPAQFTKYANFNITEESQTMANNEKGNDRYMKPEDINKETFRWRTKDKEVKIDEMDVDFKLTALTHALNKANNNYAEYQKHERLRNKYHKNVEYFMALIEVLQDSLLEDHNLQTPNSIEDVAAMRRMIKEGVIKVENYEAPNPRSEEDPPANIKDPKAEEQENEVQL